MLFDDIDEEHRQRAIRALEESLFPKISHGAHYFNDVPPALPGFTQALQEPGVPNYRVVVDPKLFKR
jgi:hypothetical protein